MIQAQRTGALFELKIRFRRSVVPAANIPPPSRGTFTRRISGLARNARPTENSIARERIQMAASSATDSGSGAADNQTGDRVPAQTSISTGQLAGPGCRVFSFSLGSRNALTTLQK